MLFVTIRCARGGGNPDPAIKSVLSELEEIEGMTSSAVTGNGHPLPTERARVLIYTSCDKKHSAQHLAEQFESLALAVSKNLPKHHYKTFLSDFSLKPAAPSEQLNQDPAKRAQAEAQYHGYYAKALEKAINKGRLSSSMVSPPLSERPSSQHDSLRCLSPWHRALADVCFLIGQHLAKQLEVEERVCCFFGGTRGARFFEEPF